MAQSCTLPDVVERSCVGPKQRSAEYNAAIRQIENLRYDPATLLTKTLMFSITAVATFCRICNKRLPLLFRRTPYLLTGCAGGRDAWPTSAGLRNTS